MGWRPRMAFCWKTPLVPYNSQYIGSCRDSFRPLGSNFRNFRHSPSGMVTSYNAPNARLLRLTRPHSRGAASLIKETRWRMYRGTLEHRQSTPNKQCNHRHRLDRFATEISAAVQPGSRMNARLPVRRYEPIN